MAKPVVSEPEKLKKQAFDNLTKKLNKYLETSSVELIHEAYQLAEYAHQEQNRSSGEPYITHPVAVATILADMNMDYQTIMAALLHDVIEDTTYSKNDLIERFGEEISELVDGVSKLTQIKFETKAEAQAANFQKMMMAMARDIRVIVIKLADRLHNMRTLQHLPAYKRRRIANETLEIYAPIANRLGMRSFRDEFYELGFYCVYPLRYQVLKKAVRDARGNRKQVIEKIQSTIEDALQKAQIQSFEVEGREKNLYSIYKKMRRKFLRLSEIMDVYGFRIIVNSVDDCYRVLGSVHSLYKPLPERFKDYIAIPKANGYQSLHTTLFGPHGIPIEIQIRTHEMHKMAENGIAAHWLYKKQHSDAACQAQLKAREWIRGVLEIQQSAGNSLEFIENVKTDLFPDEVYVFSPNGDIFELPQGATAVDFAYAVHSDVGNNCIAVKIDKQLVPLSTRLQSGQTIEVITASGTSPNPAWLNFVVTGKARSSIRHFLKKQQRSESINLGKRLLEQALKPYKKRASDFSDQQKHQVAEAVGLKSYEDLLEAIGLGNQFAQIVVQHLMGQTQHQIEAEDDDSHTEDLAIKGTEGMAVSFARCCYPIPGDPITGVLTSGRGIVVHGDHCPNAIHSHKRHPDKCIPVRWEDQAEGNFNVSLIIELENRRGSLAKLTQAVSSAESNIEDISVNEYDGRFASVKLLLVVKSRVHLARVIRRIRQITYVMRIYRSTSRHSSHTE